MGEVESSEQQLSSKMDAAKFLATSIEIIQEAFGQDQSQKDESIGWLRESEGDQDALASKMMGIVLGLPEHQRQEFIDAMTKVLESGSEKG
jgi:uncharacterized tellurite resistance protein B-like protein